jgi:hypothetical protein
MATPIQRSWESREFNEQIKLGVLELTHFLNSFGTPLLFPLLTTGAMYACAADSSAKFRLAAINGKLSSLERQVEYVEAALQSVKQQAD